VSALTPPLKWHGGKHYIASRIVALMQPHIHYVEPFFGGGAVMLAKNPEGVSEVANDLNGRLIGFWRVLQETDSFSQFIRKTQAIPFSEQEWEDSRQPREDKIEDAVSFFVFCRQSLAGRMAGFASVSRSRTRRGMNEQASAWWTAVDGLEAVYIRMRRVLILNHDAIKVIQENDGPGTCHYLDPPYPHSSRSSTGEYGNLEMTDPQHAALLETAKQCRGQVIISSYDSPVYNETLKGWNRHAFELPNNAASGSSKRRMVEVCWTNR